MKKVLIIKIGALGDLSYALPAAKALKNAFECEITWVVGKTCQSFLAGHHYIDHLVTVDEKKLYSKKHWEKLFELAKLFFNLRHRFDYVIIMHRDTLYHHAFKWFAREKVFQLIRTPEKNSAGLIYIKPMSLHESLAFKKLIESVIQFNHSQKNLTWDWDYSHIKNYAANLPEKFIAIHVGGGVNAKTEFQLKRWPHWSELVMKLLDNTTHSLVFVGAPSEKNEFDAIEKRVCESKQFSRCINLIGKTTLPELVAVIRRADFFIGVDSGPLHIADSLDKKCIGLYGPTSPISWGLLSKNAHALHHAVPCSPCYQDTGVFPECHFQQQCMQLLASETVFAYLKQNL